MVLTAVLIAVGALKKILYIVFFNSKKRWVRIISEGQNIFDCPSDIPYYNFFLSYCLFIYFYSLFFNLSHLGRGPEGPSYVHENDNNNNIYNIKCNNGCTMTKTRF